MSSYVSMVNSDAYSSQIGLVYLASTFVNGLNSGDQLTRVESELRIVNSLSRQLSHHWLGRFMLHTSDSEEVSSDSMDVAFHAQCGKNMFNDDLLNNDVAFDSTSALRSNLPVGQTAFPTAANNTLSNATTPAVPMDKSLSSYLEFNERCFLHTGVINWLAYLALRTVYPDLFDLVSSS